MTTPTPNGWHRRGNTRASRARAVKYASSEHRQTRKAIQAKLDKGHAVSCWRCGGPIPNVSRLWHVGHDDVNTQLIRGAEHARCNLKAAARKGARVANTRRQRTRRASRAW